MVDLASAEAGIRHVFGFTSIAEASIGAAPPGNSIAQWSGGKVPQFSVLSRELYAFPMQVTRCDATSRGDKSMS